MKLLHGVLSSGPNESTFTLNSKEGKEIVNGRMALPFKEAVNLTKQLAASGEVFEALKNLHEVVMRSTDRTIFDNGFNSHVIAVAGEMINKLESK